MKFEGATSDFDSIAEGDLNGNIVEVGFRPSGDLHVGNLLTIAYGAAVADRLLMDLEVTCCDTDWSAHLHETHRPQNNRVMKLFYDRSCGCGSHENVAEHAMSVLEPFFESLETHFDIKVRERFLTDLQGDRGYTDALRAVLKNMEEFDSFYGGGFRRRYVSPVTATCDTCGFAHAKGASFSPGTDELVAPCRNRGCPNGFITEPLDGEIGVYYLVDPVRDIFQDVAVHVFGGDYRTAEKEQKTSKVAKVARTTELATGTTPEYFLAPMISDKHGKPLSKSKGTGRTTQEIEDLKEFGSRIAFQTQDWLNDERKHVEQSELL
ncbi:MAG: hypothetical protein ABEJ03_02175 [Candidatus Nanohaloarchaea archaeon]